MNLYKQLFRKGNDIKQSNKAYRPIKKIISSITGLTLESFILCMCDGDLSVLAPGCVDVSDYDLLKAWESIYSEYVNAMKDKEQKYLLRLTKEINLLQYRITAINTIIQVMDMEYRVFKRRDEKMIVELKKYMVVTGQFNPEDAVSYMRDLEVIMANARRLMTEYETKQIEYDKLVPVNSKVKVDKKHFDDIITQLSKHMKSLINPKEITVSLFVSMMNDMRTEIDRIEKELRKAKKR